MRSYILKSLSGLALLSALFLSTSCKDKNCESAKGFDAELIAEYENFVGSDPTLNINLAASSDIINIINPATVTEENGRIKINYPAVTFKDGKDVYRIEEIRTDRSNGDDCWITDDENFLSWSASKSLDVVIVLDVSSSIGSNLGTIKDGAANIVSTILGQNAAAKIAVVKFSRGNVDSGFSSTETDLVNFIQQETTFNSPDIGDYVLEGRNETALYEAIDRAIQLLTDSDANGKGILTFTDGVSNFQFDPAFQSNASIIADLKDNNINSYTVGFEGNQGNVDRSALEKISVNGDFSFPDNLSDLDEVFTDFSNNVAAVYDLIYETNNGKFSKAIEYRFLFKTQKVN
ncbi:MAG: VWA domain-containing protein [Phaeodactylibacter sp.]|nr:VWA domain-containing protein [Phaeodactylibacter sp.]